MEDLLTNEVREELAMCHVTTKYSKKYNDKRCAIPEVRDDLEKYGEQVMSDAKLLALVIGSTVDKAREVLNYFDNDIVKLQNFSNSCPGVELTGREESNLAAYAALLKRTLRKRAYDSNVKFTEASVIYEYLGKIIKNKEEEHFIMASLDSSFRLIAIDEISKGAINRTIVSPRDVAITAVKNKAVNIVVLHNHPSGDPTPSEEDVELTHRLFDTMKILGIPLVDHVICGKDRYFSFEMAEEFS